MENTPKGIIFHAEDDSRLQEFVKEAAEEAGHTVALSVRSVAQAMAAIPDVLQELGVNVAILDGELLGGSGEEVADAIRASHLGIALIGYSGRRFNNVDASVLKGGGFGNLIHAINTSLSQKV